MWLYDIDRSDDTDPTLARMPPWKATALVIAGAIVAIPCLLAPGLFLGGTSEAPLVAPALGFGLAIVSFPLLAHLAGVPPGVLFIRLPTHNTGRWVLVGVGLVGTVVVTVGLLGSGSYVVRVDLPGHVLFALSVGLLVGLWTGTVEEILLRGYLLSVVGHRWHWPGAVALSAILFGLLHHGAATDLMGKLAYMVVTTLAGAFFGLVTIRTGNVWNAVALHGTWNAAFHPSVIRLEDVCDAADALLGYAPPPDHVLLGGSVTAPTESPIVAVLFGIAGVVALHHWYGPGSDS